MANYIVSDTDLTAIADAIREKGETSESLVFPTGFVDAIDAIETGGGKIVTGSFVLSEDYAYNSTATTYTGSLLINTGLSEIHSVFVIDEKWYDKTITRPGFGWATWFSRKSVGLESGGQFTTLGGFGGGTAASTTNWAPSLQKTIGPITNEYASNVPAGAFGMKMPSASYPIKAGDTILWYATGV